jgi:hypothetical protein
MILIDLFVILLIGLLLVAGTARRRHRTAQATAKAIRILGKTIAYCILIPILIVIWNEVIRLYAAN